MDHPSRRTLLRAAAGLSAAAVGGGLLTGCSRDDARPPRPSAPGRWPGHRPGCISLGVSSGLDHDEDDTGPLTASRRFFQWDEEAKEAAAIAEDHAAGRLPWVSFKPAERDRGGWRAIFLGEHDDELRARARRYAELRSPVVVTFHHEPHGDATGSPNQFGKAWSHVHDVMDDETGLANVAFAPIIGEWLWNPRSTIAQPGQYITGDVLDRSPFLGVDVYQTRSPETWAERLPRVYDWLADRGHPDLMLGIGETGASDTLGGIPAVDWWEQSWDWAAGQAGRIGVVCYFNSLLNNDAEANWLLSESPEKLAAFRASATSSAACAA